MDAILDFLSERFLISKLVRYFLINFESISLSGREENRKTYCYDDGYFGFLIGTILAIYFSTSCTDTSHQV